MVTFAQLRDADPALYSTAAAAWTGLAAAMETQADDLIRDTRPLQGWEGTAGVAARAHLDRIRVDVEDNQVPLRQVATLLDAHHEQVLKAKGMLHSALTRALALPATVADDGTITPAGAVEPGRVEGLVREFEAALRVAAESDNHTAQGLIQLVPGNGTALTAVPLASVPARGTSPAAVREWWRGLSDTERRFLITRHPELVGWLDGIPAADRDLANRLVLEQRRETLGARRAELEARGDLSGAEKKELDGIRRTLKGLDALDDRLVNSPRGADGSEQRAYLLGVDTAHDGRAVIAVGNPDEADNVVTYLPGTGADLSKVGGDIARADRMAFDANKLDPTRRTAAVMWLGYDAPDNLLAATSDKYAKGAETDLSRFQNGLRVTHDGVPSHASIIGHSYGSTTVGYAAREHCGFVDDLIFVGSPGVGVDRAPDLGVGGDHVWSSTAKNDPIQYASNPFTPKADLVFGTNPSTERFGGQVFTSDPGDPLIKKKNFSIDIFGHHVGTVSVPSGIDTNAHSQYWDEHNRSRENIARIVTGHYADVR
ncbi:alpha/beta hydrolase [Longispora urticae]